MKEIRIRKDTQEWGDHEILEGIRVRDKLLTKFRSSKTHVDYVNFKKARNHVQNLIKREKKSFIVGKQNENIGKPKELWKCLKSLGLSSGNNSPSKICLNDKGKPSFDDKSNAEIFKGFFSNLASDLVKKLKPSSHRLDEVRKSYQHMNLSDSFSLLPTSSENVLKLLEEINPSKATCLDNIAGRFLKDGAAALAEPLTELCNLSILQSKFPDGCKQAKLKPLFKKGSKDDPKNYRPISLLPQLSKIIEKIIHGQVQKFLDENRILYRYQSGFRAHHSTDTCLSYLSDKILQGFENGKFTGMIMIDLQKTFDTIDHNIFLDKLAYLGFNKSAILWFKSYLQDRSFTVNIGKEYSNHGNLSCGVPQWSILGPLIFLLYVNDMARAVDCDLLLYVDDSCLIVRDNSIEQIESSLNKNFNALWDWFLENKLSIHFGEDKTKSILFSNKKCKNIKKLDIRRGDIKIKQHSNVNYLGCLLDENLSGESMATKMLGKINGKLKFLYRKQNYLNKSLRRLLLNALIQPHFDYACTSWYPGLNKRLSKKSQTAQNKCVRFYLDLKNTAHIGVTEFKAINWLPIKNRIDQCVCVNIMKFFKETAPAYSGEIFHPVNQGRATRRSKFKLEFLFRKSSAGQKSLSYLGPKIWNSLPSELKLSNNINTFKHKIKENFFRNIQKEEDDIYVFH